MSNNPLLYLPETHIQKLKLLHISNVSLKGIHVKALHKSHINVIITENYHICCLSSYKSLCFAHKFWYISCSDILPKISIKVIYIYISVSISVILLNLLSSFIHFFDRKSYKPFSISVISLNFRDILCGIYLTNIWIADLIFKDKFVVKEKSWRSGPLCFTAFGILIWFTILVQFVLIFLSLPRLMIVIHPVVTQFKRTGFVLKSLVSLVCLSFLSALFVTLSFRFNYEIVPTSLCLPFIDPTNLIIMIKVITWIFVITQTVTSIVMTAIYVLLIKRVKESQKKLIESKSSQDSDTVLIIQLVVITTSNTLSWFPANGIYLAAMFLSTYPIDLILWAAVIGMPLNSMINPSVFTLVFIRKYINSRKSKITNKKGIISQY